MNKLFNNTYIQYHKHNDSDGICFSVNDKDKIDFLKMCFNVFKYKTIVIRDYTEEHRKMKEISYDIDSE